MEDDSMALGRRRREQQAMWVATSDLPRSAGHVFYQKLNKLLREAGFDDFVEQLCRPYYAEEIGRPGIPPGIYFRMLFVGYFEGIAAQRGIAWRCGDSLSLREFLGLHPTEKSPDHSSLSRVRERLPFEVHAEVFRFVLEIAEEKKLLRGKTVAVDATTLEANAAMKTIVRCDTGQNWKEYLTELMREAGEIDEDEEPTDEELRRFDKRRQNKKVSNEEWESPTDPDSRIIRMKDGRTHLAYKAENVIDTDTDLIVGAEVYTADRGDAETMIESVMEAQTHLNEAGIDAEIEEVAADKGYHSAEALANADELQLRTYIPEQERKTKRRWTDKPAEQQRCVYNNRRRLKRAKGRRLQHLRSELVERTFAHMCETGGARRTWLRGLEKVRKRWLIHAAARNLGMLLRHVFGIGTARAMQDVQGLALRLYFACLIILAPRFADQRCARPSPSHAHRPVRSSLRRLWFSWPMRFGRFTTGC
jgi:transposase